MNRQKILKMASEILRYVYLSLDDNKNFKVSQQRLIIGVSRIITKYVKDLERKRWVEMKGLECCQKPNLL